MTTDTEIASLALSHLGHSTTLNNLATDTTDAAKALLVFFPTVRDLVLRDYPWGFAKRAARLSLVAENPTTEWGYAYRRPADCLFMRRFVRVRTPQLSLLHSLEEASDVSGGLIYADISEAILEYTARVTNVALYPPDFVMAMSFRLASYAAPRLSQGDKQQLGVRAMQLYQREIARAQNNAANESTPDYPVESEMITARN